MEVGEWNRHVVFVWMGYADAWLGQPRTRRQHMHTAMRLVIYVQMYVSAVICNTVCSLPHLQALLISTCSGRRRALKDATNWRMDLYERGITFASNDELCTVSYSGVQKGEVREVRVTRSRNASGRHGYSDLAACRRCLASGRRYDKTAAAAGLQQ